LEELSRSEITKSKAMSILNTDRYYQINFPPILCENSHFAHVHYTAYYQPFHFGRVSLSMNEDKVIHL
jgi:hypothetical protein